MAVLRSTQNQRLFQEPVALAMKPRLLLSFHRKPSSSGTLGIAGGRLACLLAVLPGLAASISLRTMCGGGRVVEHRVPNVGLEADPILRHILRTHGTDALADVTLFKQADKPAIGYAGYRRGGGHNQH